MVIEEAQNDEQQNQSNSNEELEGGGSANTTQASQTDATVTESHSDVPDAAPPCDDQSSSAATVNTSSGLSIILSPPPTSTLDTSHLRGRIGTALICISGGGGVNLRIRDLGVRALFRCEMSNTACYSCSDALRRTWKNLAHCLLSIHRYVDALVILYKGRSMALAEIIPCRRWELLDRRHFIYKNRSLVQVTCPVWSDDYAGPAARRTVCKCCQVPLHESDNLRQGSLLIYQTIHDAIHTKSGQGAKEALKLQYIKTENDCVMGMGMHILKSAKSC